MSEKKESAASVLIGAAFLMATSAIGPGFLTQTTVFTDQLKAAFAFAIVVSIIIDIIVQLNIWRILGVSGKRAQDVANEVFPGLGYFIAILVAIGGLIFNIGNVGGAAMGLNVICGIPLAPAAVISALCAIVLFISKRGGQAMDMFTKVLGIIMLAMVGFMVVKTQPPVGLALKETVIPSQIDWLTILTLVGGTVGGYITFSGAHRIIDAKHHRRRQPRKISHGSISAVCITGVMRYLLFLAVLGVVVGGAVLDPSNPPASAFRIGAGELGYRIFGVILWCAAVTSVVGASYTSISFLRTLFARVEAKHRYWIIGFILHFDCDLHDDGQSRHAAHLRWLRKRTDTPHIARRDTARRPQKEHHRRRLQAPDSPHDSWMGHGRLHGMDGARSLLHRNNEAFRLAPL